MDMVERVGILRNLSKKDVFRKAMRCLKGGSLFDGVLISHDFQVYEMRGDIPQYVIDYCDNILMTHVRSFRTLRERRHDRDVLSVAKSFDGTFVTRHNEVNAKSDTILK